MTDFFDNIDFDAATDIEQLSRLAYELRENRNTVLKLHGVEDETALLHSIQAGEITEHPAYEHYLAARILADTRETVRAALAERLKEVHTK